MGRTSITVQSYYPNQTNQLLERLANEEPDRPLLLVGFGEDMKWLCRLLGSRVAGIYDWRSEYQGYDIGTLAIQELSSCANAHAGLVICPPELASIEEALREIIAIPSLSVLPVLWNTPTAYEPCTQESWARPICERARQRAASVNTPDRLYNLMQVVRETTLLSGSVVECGTFEGGTASLIWETLQAQEDPRSLLLFDSFQGLPTHHFGVDARWGGTFSNISFAEIRNRFAQCQGVQLINGNILDTISNLESPVSLALIDVDSYETALAVTRHIWPLLEPGGLLLYDDYGFLPNCLPLKIVVDDFFQDKGASALRFFLPSNGFLVRKNV